MSKGSLIDIAKQIFKEEKRDLPFNILWNKVCEVAGLSDSEKMNKISSFYTLLSTDGSFFFKKDTKCWALAALQKVDELKKNKLDFDKLDDSSSDDDDEEKYVEEDEEDFDDISSKELKKKNVPDQDSDDPKEEDISEDL